MLTAGLFDLTAAWDAEAIAKAASTAAQWAQTAAVKSPVILTAVAVPVWNAVNDPTTRGLGDSARALSYHEPA